MDQYPLEGNCWFTGSLGSGKTLVSVGLIRDKILAGCRVATNLDLYLHHLLPRDFVLSPGQVIRLPDKPTLEDFESIGWGNKSNNEKENGILVLDELGTWFNARTFSSDKTRQPIIDWLLHARKYGWNLGLIVQDVELVDKQARISLGDQVVKCTRTDRYSIPYVGWIFKQFTGFRLTLPKFHVGKVHVNGHYDHSISYRGRDLYRGYDTKQIFNHEAGSCSLLSPKSFYPYYFFPSCTQDLRFFMRMTKIYLKRISRPASFVTGVVLCSFLFGIVLLFTASDSVSSVPVGADPVQVAPLVDLLVKYKDYKITSFSNLPNTIPYYEITDLEGNSINSRELFRQGLSVIGQGPRAFKLSQGENNSVTIYSN